jgi:hypothetical protein
LGLVIPDPDLDILPIPDPGVKKAPDPGSGSATLPGAIESIEIILFFKLILIYKFSKKLY